MPSQTVLNKLLEAKVLPENSGLFNLYDTLEDKPDLEKLFEVLISVKDKNGHPAVMTPVTSMANPDFEKIKDSGFMEYYYEPFTETLKRYGRDSLTLDTWKKGMNMGVFIPQLHGREHITVQIWLKALRTGNRSLRYAFDNGFVALPVKGLSDVVQGFRPEFYFNDPDQIGFLKSSLSDGIRLFREIFGFAPSVFIPSDGVFHPLFEKMLGDSGIKYLNTSHFSKIPDDNGKIRFKYRQSGRTTSDGITYYTRNCSFEPLLNGIGSVEHTMKQIEAAFRWGKPANISMHRANFTGSIDEKNRANGLGTLKLLLDSIIRKWPETEFMSSDEMLRFLYPVN